MAEMMSVAGEAAVLDRIHRAYKPYRNTRGRVGLLFELSSGGVGDGMVFGQSVSLFRDPLKFAVDNVIPSVAKSAAKLVVLHLPSTKGSDTGYFRFDALARLARLGLGIDRVSEWRDALRAIRGAGADVYVYLGSPRTRMTESAVRSELDPYLAPGVGGVILDAAEKSNRDTARSIRDAIPPGVGVGVEPRPPAGNASAAMQYRPSIVYDRAWWAFAASGRVLDRGWFRTDPDIYPPADPRRARARTHNLAGRGIEVVLSLVPPPGIRRPTRAIASALVGMGYTVLQYGYHPWWVDGDVWVV